MKQSVRIAFFFLVALLSFTTVEAQDTILQKKSIYKISFLAWTMGYTTFTYEHRVKQNASY
jgi:hypothetical protein